MKKLLITILVVLTFIISGDFALAQKGTVVYYSSGGAKVAKALVKSFAKKYPDITVETIIGGTGELVTRIKTILRRTHNVEEKVEKKEELFVADAKAREIRFKGKSLELTAAEYDILGMLLQHKNGSVSREQLLYESEHIDDDSSIKNIDVIISRIRQKIAKIDPDNIYIKPIRGVGYLLTDRV